jgi:hypothetical protein
LCIRDTSGYYEKRYSCGAENFFLCLGFFINFTFFRRRDAKFRFGGRTEAGSGSGGADSCANHHDYHSDSATAHQFNDNNNYNKEDSNNNCTKGIIIIGPICVNIYFDRPKC